ncbi:hypothetical protein BGW38_008262 [Lunasporangiospora selenospora]|uniref:Uncharacterized protein n=1 Tax=Lunasporangiospora selenospora TaxID=979761 RepID=A0A9P6FKG2_9FUNG|nr:hypothetical protein BGW38_008262 [Lunasporangiospora selenospora]
MEQLPTNSEQGEYEDGAKDLDGCTSWIDKAGDMVWVMVPGSFDDDELDKARAIGNAEEFVKNNYTFCVPYSQFGNKKKWVYREASNKSAKAES